VHLRQKPNLGLVERKGRLIMKSLREPSEFISVFIQASGYLGRSTFISSWEKMGMGFGLPRFPQQAFNLGQFFFQ